MYTSITNTTNRFTLLKILIALCVLLNLSGLFVTIIGPDGALYASIAKTMVQQNNYIELFSRGTDWLDKPHLPFWITAFFFKIFGFKTWAYKLPGILCLLMGARYTYLLAKDFYNKEIALWAVLILLTAQHIITSNNDVRAEGYLTGFIAAAIYYFHKVIDNKKKIPLLLGSFFTALAIMTKGMFALIPIGGAIAGGLLIEKNWKQLFNLQWLTAALLITVFILPEIYCLYYQFDVHPEKLIFGQHNVSGIKFFFWDSQFGRFFNTGPIKGRGNTFFFFHTLLWAFLPWSILLYCAFAKRFKSLLQKDFLHNEWFSFAGCVLTFVLFSLSKFQLPHYLNIVFPFFSIITASYVFTLSKRTFNYLTTIQNSILLLLSAGVILLYIYYADNMNRVLLIMLLIGFVLVLVLPKKLLSNSKERLIAKGVLLSIIINLYLNIYLYPSLLTYQSGSEAAFFANKNYKDVPVVEINNFSWPLEFYINAPVYLLDSSKFDLPRKPYLIYMASAGIDLLTLKGIQYTAIKKFKDFKISQLSLSFLSKKKRENTLLEYQLLLVK